MMIDDNAISLQRGPELKDICNSLLCTSPKKRGGPEPAGPALPGTECGQGMHCFEGKCVERKDEDQEIPQAEWSSWVDGPCQYNCIKGSVGTRVSRRRCLPPPRVTSYKDCPGSPSRTLPCRDFSTSYCKDGEKDVNAYASEQCKEFRDNDKRLSLFMTNEGRKMRFNKRFPSRCCTIHCKMTSTGFYGPVVEMEGRIEGREGGTSLSPYFPDGTVCNTDDRGRDMYCLGGVCKPPSTRNSRTEDRGGDDDGYPVVHMAKPTEDEADDGPRQFFITNEDGSPGEEPKHDLDFDPNANQFNMEDEMKKW